jgi:soluble lytic murein transglycosylase-like protein
MVSPMAMRARSSLLAFVAGLAVLAAPAPSVGTVAVQPPPDRHAGAAPAAPAADLVALARVAPRPRAEPGNADLRCTKKRTHCIARATYIRDVCRTIEDVARANALDANFFARLLWKESLFDAAAVSPAGAEGIAQFMPGTAAAIGLADPFDPEAAIDAQAHLMRDLLGRFGSVPLALAAYNAGAGAVAGCGCIPPFPETRAYVSRILGLLGGAGDVSPGGFEVRLVG